MFTENHTIAPTDLGGGVVRKVLSYSENLMCVELVFEEGAIGAIHSHPHEQIGYIIEGSFLVQEEGKPDQLLHAGDTYYIEPNVKHGVIAQEHSKLLDVFTPMREDFV